MVQLPQRIKPSGLFLQSKLLTKENEDSAKECFTKFAMSFIRDHVLLSDAVIEDQLSATEPFESVHSDGNWRTNITPVIPHSLPENNIIDLSGEWSIKKWPFTSTEEKLASPRLSDSSWEKAVQPGRLFTLDPNVDPATIPNWNRVKTHHIDPEDGAVIRRTVTIPEEWKNKEIFIDCDSIYPGGRIYINGHLVADHASGLTPICRNITSLVKAGSAVTVAVRLYRNHSYIMMDMPRHSVDFGGMAQPVYIFAKEKCHVEDYYLPSHLDESLKKGKIEGHIRFCNNAKKAQKGSVSVRMYNPDGSFNTDASFSYEVAAGQRLDIPVCVNVNKPLLWNDEHPHLYRVELIVSAPGVPEEKYSFRTGFRRFEFKDSRAYLNGKPVKFRGVNHLSAHPQHGLHTPKDWLRRNLELMKFANVNCIRTHYMGPRYLADLCDEMGFYLVQELPLDWGTQYIHKPEWVGPALMRLHAGVCRDRNHPSIMIWAIGNENMPETDDVADDGWFHLAMYERFVKRLDPKGITMFPPPGPATTIEGVLELRVGDVADTHYSFVPIKKFLRDGKVENPRSWNPQKMEINTREEALARGWSGTWFSSEYCLFNAYPDAIFSPGLCSAIDDEPIKYPRDTPQIKVFYDRLKREWGFMRHEETCLGGAFFPWMSGGSSISYGHPFSWTVLSEDCDWGVMTPELLPKPNFWVLRNLLCPVWFPDEIEWFEGEDALTIELWNQYNDRDLGECTIRITPCDATLEWADIKIELAPGEKKVFSIPFWDKNDIKGLKEGHEIVFRLWIIEPDGFVSTAKDIIIFNGNRTRIEAGLKFDVSAEPAYIEKEKRLD